MSTNYNLNRNDNNDKKNNNAFHWFLLTYITINGIATGQVIAHTTDMIKNGYDRQTTILILLWLLSFIYSAQRIYEINRDRKNRNNNNDKTR